MEQILMPLAIIGAFLFIAFGLSAANSIEAKESETVSNILTGFLILGIVCFLIGFFGLIIIGFFF
ncbi:hypothetical protein [Flavobacterium sp. N2820]|uniref:hypothetical protein n=1 Tax=Flavobacterium sp. N2820 TaxID=2986834 RepID=UPI002223F1BC|nr:hypothetical protein [Flavobacterium sp. N2820]